MSQGWCVHKFGGTSLANAEAYRSASRIVLDNHTHRTAIVVSAQGTLKHSDGSTKEDKVTNMLYTATTLAANRNPAYKATLAALQQRHYAVADELLGHNTLEATHYKKDIDSDFGDLEHILQTVWLSKGLTDMDWWTGYGEVWSAKLMAAHLRQLLCNTSPTNANVKDKRSVRHEAAQALDARTVLSVKNHPMGVIPEIEISKHSLQQWLNIHPDVELLVITGYIATLNTGSPCTLGRDGSDYSASIFGVLLNAASVTIWTDVDGVYSANPAAVKKAVIRPELSYSEAMELAYFGAKVIHPKTMTPVVVHKIPVYIRNTFAASHPGSKICSPESKKPSRVLIQGFSCINNLCLVNVEGSGMIGVPGVARRLFQSIQEANCSVVLITQAGSEHSICVAVPFHQADRVVDAITRQFRDELEYKEIQTIEKVGPVACLASVGENMSSTPGVAAKIFSALAAKKINLRAIAQGSSERNVSAIIDQKDADSALNAVHDFFVRQDSQITCCLIAANDATAAEIYSVFCSKILDSDGIVVTAVGTPEKVVRVPEKTSSEMLSKLLAESKQEFDVANLSSEIKNALSSTYILIDCSWSPKVSRFYSDFEKAGFKILSANPTFEKKTPNVNFDLLLDWLSGSGAPLNMIVGIARKRGRSLRKLRAVLPTPASALIAGSNQADIASRFPFFSFDLWRENELSKGSIEKNLLGFISHVLECPVKDVTVSTSFQKQVNEALHGSHSSASVAANFNSSGQGEIQIQTDHHGPFSFSYQLYFEKEERPTCLSSGWISRQVLAQSIVELVKAQRTDQ